MIFIIWPFFNGYCTRQVSIFIILFSEFILILFWWDGRTRIFFFVIHYMFLDNNECKIFYYLLITEKKIRIFWLVSSFIDLDHIQLIILMCLTFYFFVMIFIQNKSFCVLKELKRNFQIKQKGVVLTNILIIVMLNFYDNCFLLDHRIFLQMS